jgi:hypothetical protein
MHLKGGFPLEACGNDTEEKEHYLSPYVGGFFGFLRDSPSKIRGYYFL